MKLFLICNLIIVRLKVFDAPRSCDNHLTLIFDHIWIFVLLRLFIEIFDKLCLNQVCIWNLGIDLLIFEGFADQALLRLFHSSLFLS